MAPRGPGRAVKDAMGDSIRDDELQIGRVLRLDRRSALDLLREISRDGAALSDLRKLWARETGRTTTCFASDPEILGQLAERVASGSLVIARVRPPPHRGAPQGEAAVSAAGMDVDAAIALAKAQAPAPALPGAVTLPGPGGLLPAAVKQLLEILEPVQIEAIDVRVEVEQALALIDMSQVRFDLGTASLQEIPGSLDRAVTALNECTSGALAAIDGL